MQKQARELDYVKSEKPLATIEVDVGTLDPEGPSVAEIVCDALAKCAAAKPALRVTAYVYPTSSLNFGEPTSSEFVIIAGPRAIFEAVLATFRGLNGVRCRPSEMIKPQINMAIAHVEQGMVWIPADVITWETLD